MKLNLDLKIESSSEWLDAVMNDFDSFLQDHADCERKASAMAMSFVAKYPDRNEIIPELIETGIEELEHFEQVYQLMRKRGISLRHSIGEDKYVSKLIKQCHISIMDIYNKDFSINYKSDNSPLTEADLICNKLICNYLSDK